MKITATIHNASRITVDGSECWIGVLYLDGKVTDVTETDRAGSAMGWARGQLRARGVSNWQTVAIPDTTSKNL